MCSPFTNSPQSGSVTLLVTVRLFSFLRRASFFREVLSLFFFDASGGSFSSSSSKGFFPWASRSAFTSPHQFLRIVLGLRRYRSLYLFLRVSIGFDMGAVNKDRLGRQVSCLRHLLQNPHKDLVYCFSRKSVTEIIAHRGKMGCFLLERVFQKPAVGHVHIYFFRRPPQ